MSYQIVKGWPAAGALDQILTPAVAGAVVPGMIVSLDASGNAIAADYASDGSNAGDMAFFCIDNDTMTGGVVTLKSGMIIECDAACYVAGVYTPNQPVTAVGGKFAALSGTEKVVAKVISFDAGTGMLRLAWCAVD